MEEGQDEIEEAAGFNANKNKVLITSQKLRHSSSLKIVSEKPERAAGGQKRVTATGMASKNAKKEESSSSGIRNNKTNDDPAAK